MEARSVDPAAETDRKIHRRCRRAKGCIEKRASTGMEKADAHRSSDPLPAKTGSGEQRAHVTPSTDAEFLAVHAGRGTSWSTGHLEPFSFFSPVRAETPESFSRRLNAFHYRRAANHPRMRRDSWSAFRVKASASVAIPVTTRVTDCAISRITASKMMLHPAVTGRPLETSRAGDGGDPFSFFAQTLTTGAGPVTLECEKGHPPLPDGRGSLSALCGMSHMPSRARERAVSAQVDT